MHEEEGQRTDATELADYIRVLRERVWVIVAAVVIVVAVATVVSLSATPQYRASARVLYQKSNLDQALFGSQVFTNTNQDREVQTGAALVELESVAQSVATELGSGLSSAALLEMISVKPETNTNVVAIEAIGIDPSEAADVANAFAGQFVLFRQSNDRATVASARELVKEQLDSLSPADLASEYGLMMKEKYESLRILESMQNGGFTVVQNASPPGSPFTPQPVRNAILALVVGLVLGIGLAFLLDYLDKRVKDEKTLEKELGVPVLASVPAVGGRWRESRRGKRSAHVIGFKTHPSLLEPFRTLRSSLHYFDVEHKSHVYVITSGLPEEGKTVTTINLALSLALSGKRVIVVEADLRKPMVNTYLGVGHDQGLSSVLAHTEEMAGVLKLVKADEYIHATNGKLKQDVEKQVLQRNFYVIPSGPLPPNPAELLSSGRMDRLIKELREAADYVLIDTPPVLLVSDALVLGRHADGIIVAVRLDASTRDEMREMKSMFERAGVRMIGAVAGGVRRSPAYYRKRGYGYKHGYELEY